MQQQQKYNIVWFTNNLRTIDNCCLQKASNSNCFGVYVFNPKHFAIDKFGFKKTEKFRAKFLIESVTNLKENLKKLNIPLLVFIDKPQIVFKQICNTYVIDEIFCLKEWTTEEVKTYNSVKNILPKNVKFTELFDQFLYHPNQVSNNYHNIPEVFTVFRKKVEKMVKVQKIVEIKPLPKINYFETQTKIPTLKELGFEDFTKHPKTAFPFSGGETAALQRLKNYLFETKNVSIYKETRNGLLGINYSTKFSPWLANGNISAKTIYWEIKKYEAQFGANQSTYWVIFELIWRDYFKFISLKHQSKIFKIGGILDKNYEWKSNKNAIQNWIDGKTQDDFVNANMLEIKHTGWMSNRGRQNVASYFAKNLLLDWRIGAAYFESILLDYDVHSNYGNWMYVSGVGNDPRDRKFNTQLQAINYDPNYEFRNTWLTEA